jgi:hypothetical protein
MSDSISSNSTANLTLQQPLTNNNNMNSLTLSNETVNNFPFQPIQPQQTIEQLKRLGFGVGDKVYLRFFDPRRLTKDQERQMKRYPIQAELDIVSESENGTWNVIFTPWDKWERNGKMKEDGTPVSTLVANVAHSTSKWAEAIEKINRQGYGIYLTVNKGGTKKEEITQFNAAFFESDEGSLEEQWKTIDAFGIKPTMVVSTKKSLHTYFSLKKNTLTTEEWTNDLQHPLIMANNSDPAIEDPNRIMRLAGFNHAKHNAHTNQFEYVLCQLHVDTDGKTPRYSVEEVKAAAAQLLPHDCSHERWTLWRRLQGNGIKSVLDVAKELNFDFAVAREQAKTMPFDELELYARRYNKFHQLCLKKAKGADVEPMSAWEDKVARLPEANIKKAVRKVSEIYTEVDSDELGDADTIRWAQYLYGYDPNGRAGWITAQCPSVPEDQRDAHSIDSLHINKATGAIKSQRGVEAREVYHMMKEIAEAAQAEEFKAEQAQQDSQGNTVWDRLSGCHRKPDAVINERFITPIDTQPGTVYIIKSAKGTGKTVAAKTIVSRFKNVLSVYTRIAQAEEQCPRIGCVFNNKPNWKNPQAKVGCVVNSMSKHDISRLADNGLLLCDEFNQIPDHLLGATLDRANERQIAYNVFEQAMAAIAGGGTGVFMSADIKNRDIQLIESLAQKAGVKKVVYIENQYQIDKGCLNVVDAESIHALLDIAAAKLEQGKHVMIGTDVKNGNNGANTIHEFLQAKYPDKKGMVVTGDNSGNTSVKDFLADINKASTELDWLIASPAITNGVSIDNGHFEVVFGLYHGILTVDDATQQLDRVRNCPEVYLWAAKTGCGSDGYSLTPEHVHETVKGNYREYAELMATLMVEHKYTGCDHQLQSAWFDHYCQAVAYRNQCMIEYREKIVQKALQDGFSSYRILEVTKEAKAAAKATQAIVKDCAERLEVVEANKVNEGEILDQSQLDSLMVADRKTEKEKASVAKTWLLRNYGEAIISKVQVEKSGETITGIPAMYIRDKKEGLHRGLERLRFLYLENGEELAMNKDLAIEGYDFKQKEFTTGRSILNLKYYLLGVRLLKKLKIDQFIDPDKVFTAEDISALFNTAKKHGDKVGSLLGLKVASYKHPSLFFDALMGRLGLQLKQSRVENKRVYQITAESWEIFQLYLAHKSTAHTVQPQQVAIKEVDAEMTYKHSGVTRIPQVAFRKMKTEYIQQLRNKCSEMTESALEAAAEAFTAQYLPLCA